MSKKLKNSRKIFIEENPYFFFTNKRNCFTKSSPFNFIQYATNIKTVNEKNQPLRLTTYNRPVSEISRTLKKLTLNSVLYGNYRNYYSNITRKYSFKKPGIKRHPLSAKKDSKGLDTYKEKKPFNFEIIKAKKRLYTASYTSKNIKGDFEELCEKSLFESAILKKIGIKKIDLNNCLEEKQKNFLFFCEYMKHADGFKDIFSQKIRIEISLLMKELR